jgi:non-ribosomal peptide synthetase component F/acyl carrier protein
VSDGVVDALVVQTSFAQQSLWLQHQVDPDLPTYNVTGVQRLHGPLDTVVLQSALNLVVDRHEVLRTVFELRDGAPVQLIGRRLPLTVAVRPVQPVDLRSAVQAEVTRPFDLARGPLLRLSLLRLSEEDHVALLVMHHVITDGVSSVLLFAELAGQYEALLAGRPLELAEPPIQYADFAVWQRDLLSGEYLDRLSAYWTDRLAVLSPLALPTDRPRPAVSTGRGAVHRFALPATLVARLQELAGRERATLFMVLLAGLDVLLARYSGQRDIAVTTPMAGRTRPELESLIGYLVNPVVLRVDVAADSSFVDLLGQVRQSCTDAFDHQEMPFERVIELVRAQRMGADPAQVILALQNMGRPSWQAAGLVFEPMDVDTGTAKADLLFDVEPGQDQYDVRLEYRTDLFDEPTARQLAASLLTVLDAVAADPGRRISRIPLLSPPERRQAVATGAAARWETARSLVTQRAADVTAILSESQQLDYATLNRTAEWMALRLSQRGIRPGMVVALLLAPSTELIIAMMAALRAGCPFTLVDPADPIPRIHRQIACSEATVVIARDGLVPAALLWDELTGEPTGQVSLPASAPTRIARHGHTPAGDVVLTTHSQLVRGATATAAALGLGAHDRLLPRTPDLESWADEVLAALTAGATIDLRSDQQPDEPYRGQVHRVDEVAGACLLLRPDAGTADPVPGCAHYLLDGWFEPVPAGVTGELYIGGPAVAVGYLGQAAGTAGRYVPDPFTGSPGDRMVRTGQLARRRRDGRYELLGRTDRVVSIGGNRIDLAEVQQVVAGLPGIESAAAVVVKATLVAFVVPAPETRLDTAQLSDLAAEKLPAWGVPDDFVELGELPRSSSGEIDHECLAALTLEPDEYTHGYVAPRTPFEREIASIWAELLGVDRVGVHDDFFELGGQSLVAVRLTARILDEFGVELTVRDLYVNYTVADMAWLVMQRITEE